MRTEKKDKQIRQLYREIKRAEEAHAPSLERVLGRQRDRRSWGFGPIGSRFRLAATAILLAVLSYPIYMRFQAQEATPEPQVTADLSQWETQTDFLLTFSGESPWYSLPTVDVSVPEWSDEEDLERYRE